MNFLQLVQRTMVEGGAPGSTGNGLTTCQNPTGEAARFVNWVNSAWLAIQAKHQDWDWLRTSASFPTVAGLANYPLSQITNTDTNTFGLTDFGKWDMDTARNYVTAVGTNSEIYMSEISYDQWRDQYSYGALRTIQTQPYQIAQKPKDHSLNLGPYPNANYTITIDYWRAPSYLVLDTDIPLIPAQYQEAIMHRALQFYGAYERDDGIIATAKEEYNRLIRECEADYLPKVTIAGALA